MADYRISGFWRYNDGNGITHYAIHRGTVGSLQIATKVTKVDAIALVRDTRNNVKTILWDYLNGVWKEGEIVEATAGRDGYLRTNPNNTVKDNLGHLINYGWIHL